MTRTYSYPFYGMICSIFMISVCSGTGALAANDYAATPFATTGPRSRPVIITALVDKRDQTQLPTDFKTYLQELRDLRANVTTKFTGMSEVKKVLYPKFGSDIATPIQLFPNVTEIFAFDALPLFAKESLDSQSVDLATPVGVSPSDSHLAPDQFTGPRILGGIKALSPKAEILGVRLESPKEHSKKFEYLAGFSPEYSGYHLSGVITFDLHDGVGPRRLIYLSTVLDPDAEKNSHTFARIEMFQPQAVIVKGANDVYSGFGSGKNGANGFSTTILSVLSGRGGLLIEGASFGKDFELSGTHVKDMEAGNDMRVINGLNEMSPGAVSRVLHGTNHIFGSNDNVLVTKFPAP